MKYFWIISTEWDQKSSQVVSISIFCVEGIKSYEELAKVKKIHGTQIQVEEF